MTVNQCKCGQFEFGSYDPDTEQDDTYSTECGATTTRIFAQGHDAKLVGFLVRAEMAGDEIGITEGGLRITLPGAVAAAASISEALAAKAQLQLDVQRAKADRKASKPSKPAKVEEPKILEPRNARIKVGRWTYDATIEGNGVATYRTRLGATHKVDASAYTEI